jgi:hypothetical protein
MLAAGDAGCVAGAGVYWACALMAKAAIAAAQASWRNECLMSLPFVGKENTYRRSCREDSGSALTLRNSKKIPQSKKGAFPTTESDNR